MPRLGAAGVDAAEVGVDREEAAGDSTDWVGLALSEF